MGEIKVLDVKVRAETDITDRGPIVKLRSKLAIEDYL